MLGMKDGCELGFSDGCKLEDGLEETVGEDVGESVKPVISGCCIAL